jgi:uncharacterized membrane protein SpoIIM required for sporulation
MNLPAFVRRNRSRWERLEQLLADLDKKKLATLNRAALREFSQLYRASASDLAYAQTHYRGTTLLLFLHQLVGRAHHEIYRGGGFSLRRIAQFFRYQVPAMARLHLDAIILSAIIFMISFALGLAAAEADPRIASLLLPPQVLDDINAGRMWTKNIFSVVPGSIRSALIFSNNITVAFLCFVGGMTFGLYTFFLLVFNGLLLGVVFKLCAQHGLLTGLLAFISSHGFVELSVIVVAASSGFVLAGALLSPGRYTRADSLALRGKSAVQLALGCVPPLIAMGVVEAFISPQEAIPLWFKVMLGLALFAAYWSYLMLGGKRPS